MIGDRALESRTPSKHKKGRRDASAPMRALTAGDQAATVTAMSLNFTLVSSAAFWKSAISLKFR